MKIDHLVHQFPPESEGGLESYVRDLVVAQRQAGSDVEVVSGSLAARPRFALEASELEGVPVTRLHRADLYFDAWDKGAHPEIEAYLRDRWARARPDLVHVHHWIRLTENIVAVARDLGLPVVVTLHDFAPSCPRAFRMYAADETPCARTLGPENCVPCAHRWPWADDAEAAAAVTWFRRNSRAELLGADVLLCASHAVGDLVAAGLDLPRDRIEILPLGARPRFSGVPARSALSDELHLAYWGSVTERKGIPLLVRAFRRAVEETGAAARLTIFGGVDRPELEARILEDAREAPVRLAGRFEYEDLPAAGIDLAVFPSLCLETWGLVLDEAQELGVPAIVPDAGAMAERLGGGGATFTIQNEDSLAAVLGRLLRDRSEVARLTAAVPRPSGSFESHQAALEAVYRRTVAGPRRPGTPEIEIDPRERAGRVFARAESMFRALLGG
ncbi:MAG: glycosyltransferase [Planctomycetota bacterium]